jgi:hypothetical protein
LTRFSRAVEKAIFERDKGICQICGRETEFGDGEIEHKISRSKGGSDNPENLQWTCHRCNKLKGNKLSNEQVRKILLLPENFDAIMQLRNRAKSMPASTLGRVNSGQTDLKHSRNILLTRSDYQGLDHWAKVNLVENLIKHGNDKLEISCLMQHFKAGYSDEFWMPLMKYKELMEKYGNPIVPFPPRFQEDIFGYGQSLRDPFERIPEDDRKELLKLKEHLLAVIDKIIFGVKNGKPLKGRCEFC